MFIGNRIAADASAATAFAGRPGCRSCAQCGNAKCPSAGLAFAPLDATQSLPLAARDSKENQSK